MDVDVREKEEEYRSDLAVITELRAENSELRSENAALLREIEVLEIALSEPKRRRSRRDEDD